MSSPMSKESENLGILVINEEIANALDLYPDDPYKQAFANPELRQKLVNYVMSGIQGLYPVLAHQQGWPVKTKFPYRSLELRLHIENYVHWGIEHLLAANSDWLVRFRTQDAQPSYTPSHRFS
ncbi:hypothetical protein [Allocoleopsis franciscana]|uniref:Uncharacterized protein n=1 Tax=Allocoleopsis franciscana PCC 7113 TaxID=1173027 RepID=K9WD68_9CYAN|nr:hypothetical protein [Allocoleopsis franciscana]AFZ17746.1 hypothetical protein Mic7113_1891 [Allocoleopsis franciscana PCC 7113]